MTSCDAHIATQIGVLAGLVVGAGIVLLTLWLENR